jgi:uncharacterized protein RhaS with RHS repeats
LQKDPIGFSGGNLNLYGYTQNNPLIYTDPSGKECNVVGSTISGATAEGNTGQIVGGVIGSTAGAAAGAAAGASIGGSIGTAVGIAVGSLGGLLTAGALGVLGGEAGSAFGGLIGGTAGGAVGSAIGGATDSSPGDVISPNENPYQPPAALPPAPPLTTVPTMDPNAGQPQISPTTLN